jgi:PAS domain S-box-containing protein
MSNTSSTGDAVQPDLAELRRAHDYSDAIEGLLGALSTQFVNVPAEQIDSLVDRALERVGRFLGVDRSYLLLFSDDGRQFSNVAEWCAPGVSPEIDRLQEVSAEQFPWIIRRLRRADLVVFSRLAELPPEAAAERAEFEREGIRSLANVPVYHSGKVVGIVGFDAVRAERHWTDEEVRILRILAELLAGAIGRKRTETALRESEERFRRAFDEGPMGMCLVGLDSRFLQVNRAYAEMLGYRPEELRGRPVASVIHADDLGDMEPLVAGVLLGQVNTVTAELRFSRKDGVTVWGRMTGTTIRDREGRVMYGLGMVEDITDRKAAEQQAQQEQELLRQLLDLHERERKLIAYEIHDGLAQQLTGALFSFQALEQMRDKTSPEAQSLFASGLQLLTDGIAEARRLISGLRPPILDQSGVVVAIEFLVADFEKRSGIAIDFSCDVHFQRLASPLENALFRVVQETLTNATRYSRSPKIEVRLEQIDRRIVLEVQDWGVGFNPDDVGEDHFGLRGIRERVRLMGGTAEFRSAPGKGTLVRVELPLIVASDSLQEAPTAHVV